MYYMYTRGSSRSGTSALRHLNSLTASAAVGADTVLLLPLSGMSGADRSSDYWSILKDVMSASNFISRRRGAHGKQAGAGHLS